MTNARQKYPNRLKQAIKQSGFTIEGIAGETDIPARTLSDYCAGRVPIPKDRLEVLAHALGYPAQYLVPKMTNGEIQTNPGRENIGQFSSPHHEQDNRLQEVSPLLSQVLAQDTTTSMGVKDVDLDTSRRLFLQGALGLAVEVSIPTEVFLLQCASSMKACWLNTIRRETIIKRHLKRLHKVLRCNRLEI